MLSDYYVQLPVIDSLINHEIEESIQILGDVNFNYAVLNKNNPMDFYITSSMPEWYGFYKENNKQCTDPVTIRTRFSEEAFFWGPALQRRGWGDNGIFSEAKKFSVESGYTLPLHDLQENIGMLNIIMKSGTVSFFKHRINESKELLISSLRRCHVMNLRLRGVMGDILPGGSPCKINEGSEWFDVVRCSDGLIAGALKLNVGDRMLMRRDEVGLINGYLHPEDRIVSRPTLIEMVREMTRNN